jgi:hypothetical protein
LPQTLYTNIQSINNVIQKQETHPNVNNQDAKTTPALHVTTKAPVRNSNHAIPGKKKTYLQTIIKLCF